MSTQSVDGETPTAEKVDDDILYTEEYKSKFWPVLFLVPPMVPFFWNYHVTITDDGLSFGYSSVISSVRIKHRTRTILEATPLFDQWWGGFGIHYKPDMKNLFGRWERQYIAENGGAVKLVVADDDDDGYNDLGSKKDVGRDGVETTTFFFSTKDPQKVCDILNKKV